MYPDVFKVESFGVNLAVYVDPLFDDETVPNVPPLIVTNVLSKVVVDGLIVNVIVAVSPGPNVVLLDETVQVTAVTRVFIVKLIDVEENVVVASLLVPDTEIEPVVLVDAVGVNVAV
jgi:hypothetical protein